jgi:hypothetical protein
MRDAGSQRVLTALFHPKYNAASMSSQPIISTKSKSRIARFSYFYSTLLDMISLSGRTIAAPPFGRCSRAILLAAILFASPVICVSQEEPTLKIEILADDHTITLNDGDTIEMGGKMVVVRTAKVKTFKMENFQFEYPRDYAYKFEEEQDFRSWTFDGNNFVIMLFEFPRTVDVSAFTKEMIKKFGKKNCSVDDKNMIIKNRELKGKRINVNLLGARLTYDLFPINLGNNKTHIIAFQDTKTESGKDSAEGTETMNLIARSINIADK